MKAIWEIKKLGELCKFIDYRGKTPQKVEDGLRLVTAKNVKMGFIQDEPLEYVNSDIYDKWMTRGIPQYGDVVFTTEAPLGNIAQLHITDKVVFAQRLIILHPVSSFIDSTFLKYHLLAPVTQEDIQSKGTGATVKGIKASLLKTIEVSFPPLPEQRRIVAILDEAFAGIAAAKENAEQNLNNAKEVFTHYLKQVFNTKKNGWVENNIGEICLLKSGTTMPYDLEKETGDIPYLKVADMNFEENIGCITMSSRFLDKKDIKDSMIIPKGAVIFPKRGGAILTNKKRMTSIPICADLNIMAVIPTCKIESKLLYYYFLDVDMKKIGTGSSIPQINNYDISPLSIAYPRYLSKQKEIVSFLDEISEETGTLKSIYQQKLSNLEELKKSLLQQAFSGAL